MTRITRNARPCPSQSQSIEVIFIRGLVTAGTCRRHRAKEEEEGKKRRNGLQRRPYSTPPHPHPHPPSPSPQISREEYHDLVDIYHDRHSQEQDQEQAQPYYPLASRLTLTPAQESQQEDSPPTHRVLALDLPQDHPDHETHLRALKSLRRLLNQPLGHISLNLLWSTYLTLPSPQPVYLTPNTLTRMFNHLTWTEFKNSHDAAMSRYFSLLNQVLDARPNEKLDATVWNSAISFAGRWMRHVTSEEVKSAVSVWMRMEQGGVQATEVTFNILYDLAVKAGRFALAGTIEQELKTRGLPLNRFFRTSVIYHAGMRRDGEGVRAAFRELVEAGEIVDTAVLNCVILSLLRAGEPGAATSVFLRMKKLHEEKFGGDALKDWREWKATGLRLDAEAKRLRDEESRHESSFFGGTFSSRGKRDAVQQSAPIEPDARTYRILIAWSVECGELARARELVEEMRGRGFHVYGGVWVGFLRGFAKFGGYVGGEWNWRVLEEIWGETMGSLDDPPPSSPSPSDHDDDNLGEQFAEMKEKEEEEEEEEEGPPIMETLRPTYFTRSLAFAAVNAFYKCMGRKRMLEVWKGDVEWRWIAQGGVSEEDLERVRRVVDRLRSMDEEEDVEERDGGDDGGGGGDGSSGEGGSDGSDKGPHRSQQQPSEPLYTPF